MATTSAERQAAYRARRATAGDNGERRLNLWVTTGSALALGRLAARYGVTQRQMIERLAGEKEKRVLSAIELDSPEWEAYFKKADVTR